MPRFFVKNNQINNDKITIIDEDVKHIKNVLRKQIGDKIEVCNQDTGNSYKCEIEIIAENEIETKIIEEQKNIREKIKVDIYQGLPKSDKMELIIQKNTEVGIKSIVPVIMERTVVKLDEKIAKLMNMISLEDMSTLMNAPMPMEFALAFNKGMMK